MEIKSVAKFVLDKPEEKANYELLLNDPDVYIIKDQFAYDKSGRAIITVWWEREEDSSLGF
tara:strand:- start:1674 stop:1856 length:183 start_codon:yes stop_codon:yes gene_type:complete